MTRDEHLAWAKERALDYVHRGDLAGAVGAMSSDLTKHPETNNETTRFLGSIGIMEIHYGRQAVIDWINGFN